MLDDFITVDPNEVEVEIQPQVPARPKKKTQPAPPIPSPTVKIVSGPQPPSPPPAASRVKEIERPKEVRKQREILADLVRTGVVPEKEKQVILASTVRKAKPKPPQLPAVDVTDIAIDLAKTPIRTAGSMLTEVPRAVGETADFFLAPFVQEDRDTGLGQFAPKENQNVFSERLSPISERATSAIEKALPPNPNLPEEVSFFTQDIPAAFTSAGMFLAGGMAGKALKVPSLLSTAGLGAIINVAEVSREADKMGIDPSRKKFAIGAALATGMTEAAGLGRALDKFGLKQTFTKRLLEIAEEGGQEALQQWLNNINAIVIGGYDQDRDQFEGVLKSAILGGITGGVFQGVSKAKEVYDERMEVRRQRNTFELVPSEVEGQSPYMIVPSWAINAMGAYPGGKAGPRGLTFDPGFEDVLSQAVREAAPTPEKGEEAAQAISRAYAAAAEQGLPTVAFVNRESVLGKDPYIVAHETFHVGQYSAVGTTDDPYARISTLHSDEFASNNPEINRLLLFERDRVEKYLSPGVRDQDLLALEIPAYVMSGEGNAFFDNPATGIKFVMDYLNDIVTNRGIDALNAIERASRIPKEQQAIIPFVRRTYESSIKQQIANGTIPVEQGNRILESLNPSTKPTGTAPAGGTKGPSISESAGVSGGIGTGGGGPEGQPITPELRTANRDRFVEKSTVKTPVYHGTTADVDFDVFEKSNDLGFHFGSSKAAEDRVTSKVYTQQGQVGEGTLLDNSRIGSFYIDLRNPLQVPDIFKPNNLKGTINELINLGKVELNMLISSKLRAMDMTDSPDLKNRLKKEVQEEVYRQLEAQGYDGFEYSNKTEDPGSASYVVFRPNQIKSATGNRGTFDPQQKNFLAAIRPKDEKIEIGDEVKIKGYANKAKVTEIFPDGGYKVKFPNGTEDEFDADKVTKVTKRVPKVTKDVTQGTPAQEDTTGFGAFFGGMAGAIRDSYRQAMVDSINKTGKLPSVERRTPIDRAFEDLVAKGEPRNADTFDKAMEQVYPKKATVEGEVVPQPSTKKTEVTKLPENVTQVTQEGTPVTPTPKPYVPPKKGVVPTLPGNMRIKKTPIYVNRIGPGDIPGTVKVELGDGSVADFSLDDVRDSSGKKIKDPLLYMLVENPPTNPIPPPPRPPAMDSPGGPGGGPVLFTTDVTPFGSRVLGQKFTELLANNNIRYTFDKAPFVQVYESLVEGKLRDAEIDTILQEEGLSWEDFAENVYNTYSRAGSTLQTLSQIVRQHWDTLKKNNPALANKLIPPSRQIGAILDDLNDTILGMSLWRRSGRLLQKATLTQYGTAAVNFITSVGRVPIDATASGLGQAVRSIVDSKGMSWTDRMERARQSGYETLMAGFEAWRGLNPTQLSDLVEGRQGKNYAKYEEVVTEVEKYFPDIHSKLFAKPLEVDVKELKEAEDKVALMKQLLPLIESRSKRQDLQVRINKLEKAVKRENSFLTKMVFGKPEAFYDFVLRPMQFGEFLMRRPQFVARLGLELKDRGISMNTVLRNTHLTEDQLASLPEEDRMTFKGLPKDAVKEALDSALEFTMALEPSTGTDARMTEKVGHHFIRMMNALGPLTLLTDTMFPKAVYSAAKTFYDYSALPFAFEWAEDGSFRRIANQVFGKGLVKDVKGGPDFRPNPPARADYDRLGRALTGSFLYMVALGAIKAGLIGDDWYELWTGQRDKNGNKIYLDMRRYIPFSRVFQLTSLVDRFATGRVNDVQAGAELMDIAFGVKKYGGDMDSIEAIDAMAEYWSGPERNPFKIDKMKQVVGKYPAALLTPFLNLRSLVAAYDEDENARKDMRGYGFWGPSMDRIPWLRNQMPNMNYPTVLGKMPLSQSPLAQQMGFQTQAAPIYMGREFQRLGINIRNYLPKDQDPVIDRAQNEIFAHLADMYGKMFEADPMYRNAPDDVKAASWEQYLIGPDGIATIAKQEALKMNPNEAARRQIIQENPGTFIRKVTGLSDYLEMLRKQ